MKELYFLTFLLITLLAQNALSQSLTKNNFEEEIAFQAFKPTINKWLRGEKIKTEFQSQGDFRFQPYLVDVNGDGKKQLAIRNECAAVGNCQFWLFERSGNGYKRSPCS